MSVILLVYNNTILLIVFTGLERMAIALAVSNKTLNYGDKILGHLTTCDSYLSQINGCIGTCEGSDQVSAIS